jgi:HlyD family secretion protein
MLLKQEQQLLSNEVNEIISYRPHWFIRRGNIIFFSIIFLLIAISFVIQYPDIVKVSARITAINAPVLLETKREGKLEKLFVRNGVEVNEGQVLAFVQSTARHEEVIQLRQWIMNTEAQLANESSNRVLIDPLPRLTALGDVQAPYQEFENRYREIKEIVKGGYYEKKKNALQQDMVYLNRIKSTATGQLQLIEKDQALQQKEFEAYEKLAEEKVIAPLELNQYKSKLISKEQALKQTETQITNSDISTHNKRKELLELDKQVTDHWQAFRSALFNLKSRVEEWIQQYIIMASVSGRLEFISALQESQLLNSGQFLFYIQPGQTVFYAEMKAGQTGIGKIKQEQKVIIKLYGYPEAEFGFIEGSVAYIASMPNERDSFQLKADLSKGLITSYNKQIYFRNNLSASAEIITDDRRLIDRMMGQLKQIWKR